MFVILFLSALRLQESGQINMGYKIRQKNWKSDACHCFFMIYNELADSKQALPSCPSQLFMPELSCFPPILVWIVARLSPGLSCSPR